LMYSGVKKPKVRFIHIIDEFIHGVGINYVYVTSLVAIMEIKLLLQRTRIGGRHADTHSRYCNNYLRTSQQLINSNNSIKKFGH
jgi:hypothetical protein